MFAHRDPAAADHPYVNFCQKLVLLASSKDSFYN
jgi:hypothetical protein